MNKIAPVENFKFIYEYDFGDSFCHDILMAKILQPDEDPEHPDHEHMLEWLGGEFDPEKFDIDEINRQLSEIK